ncbi:MAG TPA: hypothetical protein VFM54_21610 [Micromonosporaceae bacterium]|nr:hypothetical protein [Micromonosporaceae bacterium]
MFRATGWTCTVSTTATCTYGDLAAGASAPVPQRRDGSGQRRDRPGEYATTFAVTATVTSGEPGSTFTVLVDAATSSTDANPANNISQTTVTIG